MQFLYSTILLQVTSDIKVIEVHLGQRSGNFFHDYFEIFLCKLILPHGEEQKKTESPLLSIFHIVAPHDKSEKKTITKNLI